MQQERSPYEDIINLPHPISTRHARMSMIDRAAQFSPFAALVGYEAVIRETARLTEEETELDESRKEILNRRLCALAENPEAAGSVSFYVYSPDSSKSGGSYAWISGQIRKIDLYRRTVLLGNGQEFWIKDIRDIEGAECEEML